MKGEHFVIAKAHLGSQVVGKIPKLGDPDDC
jgi:hypothetical protein